MTTLHLATGRGPVVVTRNGDRWSAEATLDRGAATCLAADPRRPERVFCATRQGVWRSDDAGASWSRVFEELPHSKVDALAVSPVERSGAHGVVYLGTEPSAVFRSGDGGATWRRCEGLTDLPSSQEWSFPPRPDTHHVRWIEPDPHLEGRLHVAIEAGSLVCTPDGGETWRDRVAGSPRDTHQLVTHPDAPGQLRSAAGDGFFASDDGGETWRRSEEGLRFRYCWSVAADPADPRTLVLSAAPGPRQAHSADRAESALYRRTGDGPWEEVRTGLPDPEGTRAAVVATHAAEPGVFYAAYAPHLYRSPDGGATWQRLDVPHLEDLAGGSRVRALVAGEPG